MKHRDPVTALLLALFVPGYNIYWFYVTAREVGSSRNIKMPSAWLLIAPFVVTLIVWPLTIMLFMILAVTAGETGEGAGIGFALASLIAPLLMLVMVGLFILYEYRFCHTISKVVTTDLSPGLMTVVCVIFSPLVTYMVQEKLNLLGQQSAVSPPPVSSVN
jgi:hypothetical protein